jgi:CheY-like chemotaxis protein
MLSRLLQLKGYAVTGAENGEQAIALALQEHPDVILMDLGLPGMSGIEAAQVLKQNTQTKQMPVIAVSGRPRHLWEETAAGAGIALYLNKPVSLAAITEAIDRVLLLPGTSSGHGPQYPTRTTG